MGKYKSWLIGAGAVAAVMASGWVMGGEHGRERRDHEGREHHGKGGTGDVRPVTDVNYRAECGSCHFAYQPALLPARSWQALLGGLSNHFGDNAALPAETVQQLEGYLVANAADTPQSGRGARIERSIAPDAAPLRISETAYFRRKHHELSPAAVAANQQVRSFAQCNACHTRAEEGSFNEHEVRIPGGGGHR